MSDQERFVSEVSEAVSRGQTAEEAVRAYVGGADGSVYPPGHLLGMEVPDGGSSCAKCRFWHVDHCHNEGFVRWNGGSGKIPVAPDCYCCDLFGAVPAYVVDRELVRQLIAEALALVPVLRGLWPGQDKDAGVEEEARHDSPHKTSVGDVEFMGERVRISTVTGENVRDPEERGGLGLLEFTMGGNAFGGPVVGYYRPISDEDEVTLHDLMGMIDFVAVACHELTERYVMKTLGLEYGFAHDNYADPVEYAIRLVLA